MKRDNENKQKSVTFKVKVAFHLIFFVGLIVYTKSYDLSIFTRLFLARDSFEILAITTVTYLFYYLIFLKKKLLYLKIIWLVVIVSCLTLMASNKIMITKYLNMNHLFELVAQYIGIAVLIFSFLWLLDNYNYVVNNKFFATTEALKESEHKLLRQQFNPHFLFNAFNSLYSMSLKNNPENPDTILKLSSMMRYLTDDTVNKKVKLVHELKFIEEYIAIEKIRFREKANIQFVIEGDVEGKSIEPLLLISLVENAFKHGFYTNDENAFVDIKTTVSDQSLLFEVRNSIQDKQHFNTSNREGKGQENLKQRLKLSYPKNHKLILQNKDNVYLAQLEINF